MTAKYKTTEYYTSPEEVKGAFVRAILAVPDLHLDQETVLQAAETFSNIMWAHDNHRSGGIAKNSKLFDLANKIENMVAGLAEVQATKRECFEILKKKGRISSLGQTSAIKILALTEIFQTFPEIAAPQDAYLITNKRKAFEILCGSSGIHLFTNSLENISKYRRYIELVASGDIVHEHFLTNEGYKHSVFRMSVDELDKRLADCEMRMARGEPKPVAEAKPAETFRRAAARGKAVKAAAPPMVPPKPRVFLDPKSAAARLMAMRAGPTG